MGNLSSFNNEEVKIFNYHKNIYEEYYKKDYIKINELEKYEYVKILITTIFFDYNSLIKTRSYFQNKKIEIESLIKLIHIENYKIELLILLEDAYYKIYNKH